MENKNQQHWKFTDYKDVTKLNRNNNFEFVAHGGKTWAPLVDWQSQNEHNSRVDPFKYAFALVNQDDLIDPVMKVSYLREISNAIVRDNYIDYSVSIKLSRHLSPPEYVDPKHLATVYIRNHPFPTTREDLMRFYGWKLRKASSTLGLLVRGGTVERKNGGYMEVRGV